MRRLGWAALCLALLPAPALGDKIDDLIARIDQAQQGLRTLQAEFSQKNRVRLFKQELTSRGRFYYERPARLRWEYLAPDPSAMVIEGPKAYLLMPGRPAQEFQAERDSTLHAIFAELELWLGSGSLAKARGEYDLKEGGTAKAPAVVLVPREGTPLSRTFSRIEMRVDAGTMLLQGLLLVEKNGDEKEIRLTRVLRNQPLPPGAFSH